MIEAHFDLVEKLIHIGPLVILANLHRIYTSPETGYIKGEIIFIDSSSLVIFQHIRIVEGELIITDYRYHYMDVDNKLIFCYDNAPHHPGIHSFPCHKHFPSGIEGASLPGIEQLLAEIDSNIIQKIKPG